MTEKLDIKHRSDNRRGRYWIAVKGGEAELTYVFNSETIMVIDHTYVPPEARGGSVAQKLVERAVADARERGYTIVPQCPYVDKLFKRRPDLNERRAA